MASVACLALAASACGSSPVASPAAPTAHLAPTSTAYPPIPPDASGPGAGCTGVRGTGMSARQVQQVVGSVTSGLGGGRISSVAGCPGGPVHVGLAPGQEPLARWLSARFGRDVALTVGLTTYAGHPGRSPRCGSLERAAPLPSGLRLGLDLDSRSVRSGSTFTGHVVVSDQGPGGFSMDTGQPLQAVVVRVGSDGSSVSTATASPGSPMVPVLARGPRARSPSSGAPRDATVVPARHCRPAPTRSSCGSPRRPRRTHPPT